MDKYEFISIITDIFADCATEEEIDTRVKEIIDVVNACSMMAKEYQKVWIK
jgi:hypothetical protein